VNLEVRHLRLIRAIAEEGGLTKAGSRLYLTQSALSHQLRDAEEKLGVSLFTRVNKRMVITPAGERLLTTARSVLDEMKRVEEDIRQIALHREGVLRICTECYTCYHWLPSLLKIFGREYPRIEVQIVVDATRRPQQALLDGKIDLALVSSPVRNSKLISKPLFQDELVAILAKDHHLNSLPFIAAKDFANEHLIIYGSPEENLFVQQVLIPAGVTPQRVSSVQLTEAIIEMVKAGVGIGIMAKWAIAPHMKSGAIRALRVTKKGLHRRWATAMLKNRDTPKYLIEFVRLLSDNPVLVVGNDKKAATAARGLRLLQGVTCSNS
jgi:LysR family transcriptional regulator for metE and metH